MRRTMLIAAAFAAAFPAVAAQAQTYTNEQLQQMFEAQRQAFTAVTSGTGLTRGLTIVTVEDIAVQAGTALDALSPPGVQNAPDEAAAALRPDPGTQQGPVTIVGIPEEMQVNLNIQFGFDSAALADDQLPALQQMCTVMQGSDINLFRIVGHTDASGSDAYNERLSALRAAEVARWLVSDCGIDSGRLETMGLGKRYLKNVDNPRGDENRRVEFQALS